MDETARRIAALSPRQRALLEARLRQAPSPRDGAPETPSSPLSFAQARVWTLARRDPSSGFFVVTRRVRLPGRVGLDTVRAALSAVAARHEALRTDVAPRDGEPLQGVGAAPPDGLRVAEPGSAADAIDAAQRGVGAREAPLFRAVAVAGPGGVELVLVAHALVCDAPSLGRVGHEVLAACGALARGDTPDLPAVTLQAPEHARKQRQRLRGVRLEQLLSRYRALEHAPALLALHTDRLRVPNRLPRVARVAWRADAARVERAKRALGPGVDEAPFWAAVASIVLSRFAGQTSVVLGVQRRPRPDFVGAATDATPVAVDLESDPPARAVVEQAAAALRGGDAQEDVPYEKLAEELRIRHSSRQNPLFQALLAVRSALEADSVPGAMDDDGWFSAGSVLFDVALAVDDTRPAPRLELLYDAHLFDEEAIRAIARSIDTVLGEIAAHPDEGVSCLALLRADEDGPAPPAGAAAGAPAFAGTIHGIYARRAALTPDAAAVDGPDPLTYRDLDRRANRLAHALIGRGVRRGETVGVCMERSADLVLSFLAILKAGAVYLPLDPSYPPDRLTFMIADSGTRVVLARDAAPAEVPHGCEVVDVGALDLAPYPAAAPGLDVAGHEAAYLIYTSGSTGKPKGVRVQHTGVCHVADAQLHHLQVTGDDRILQFSSPSFDASISELVMAAACGGTLCVADADELMPGPPLLEVLRTRRITVLTIPPSTLAALAPIELPELRLILAAGETCPAEQVARWAPGRRFLNAYGPTEASIWATVAECATGDRNPPIGLPLAHIETRVVDDRLRELPVGAPGELVLGGPAVALGYHDRPELTAERFLSSLPGVPDGETRWYRTGDLVRRDAAGRLWHLGRIDRQVKLRGFRIEPAEVEALLLELTGVTAAAVEVESDVLVAYYVAGDPAPDPEGLKDALARRLPQWLVPQRWVALQAMPIGANGKLDRAALAREASRRNVGSQPPRTPTERALVDIWKTVLGLDEVGIEANFFQIGGHSLLAASVISRASAALGREVPLRTMFQLPTIADLARAFEDNGHLERLTP